jgi:hypothetical protein
LPSVPKSQSTVGVPSVLSDPPRGTVAANADAGTAPPVSSGVVLAARRTGDAASSCVRHGTSALPCASIHPIHRGSGTDFVNLKYIEQGGEGNIPWMKLED